MLLIWSLLLLISENNNVIHCMYITACILTVKINEENNVSISMYLCMYCICMFDTTFYMHAYIPGANII